MKEIIIQNILYLSHGYGTLFRKGVIAEVKVPQIPTKNDSFCKGRYTSVVDSILRHHNLLKRVHFLTVNANNCHLHTKMAKMQIM